MNQHDDRKNSFFSIRKLGAILFVLVFAESLLGQLSASSQFQDLFSVNIARLTSAGSYHTVLFDAHVTFGILLVILAFWALTRAIRMPSKRALFFATLFTFIAIGSAAATGTIFLETNFAQGILIDRDLAFVALAGSILMIVLGSVPIPERLEL